MNGNLDPDVARIAERSHAVMCDLIDIERKLGPHVLVFALSIVHARPVARRELGELDRDGAVGGLRVAERIPDVVRQRAHGEGQFIGVVRVAKQRDHKITRAHVMGQVGEEFVARRVVADVLNHAPAVRVSPRLVQLRRRQVGIAAHEERHDRVLPGEVDQLLMGQERIRASLRGACAQQEEEKQRDSAEPV